MGNIGNIDNKWFLDYGGDGNFRLRPYVGDSTIEDDILYKLLEDEIELKDNYDLCFYIGDTDFELNIGMYDIEDNKIVHEFLSFDTDEVVSDLIQRELAKGDGISYFSLQYSWTNKTFDGLDFVGEDDFDYSFYIKDAIETEEDDE